ncbi:MAG: YicC/YloC family endoribonuclease [Verrucomicrobiota bacterium]
MLSMTGYGRGYAEEHGNCVTIGISAVNHKTRDIRFNLPPELNALEGRLKRQVTESIKRGSVYITLEYELSPEHKAEQTSIDKYLAGRVINELKEIAREHELNREISPAALVNVPGVVEVKTQAVPAEILANLAATALNEALQQLVAARKQEGEELSKDFDARLLTLMQIVKQIEANQTDVLQAYKKQLQNRMTELGVELTGDDQRLVQEAAWMAQKADISEEITRLKTHLDRFRNDLSVDDQPVGRGLYFISQEILREINTLASKSRDTTIADHAIDFKTELERIREQVLNIE